MLCYVAPVVFILSWFTGFGFGAPVSDVVNTPADQFFGGRSVLITREQFVTAHHFAQLLASPWFHALASPNCSCPITTVVYHHDGHCQCIEKGAKHVVESNVPEHSNSTKATVLDALAVGITVVKAKALKMVIAKKPGPVVSINASETTVMSAHLQPILVCVSKGCFRSHQSTGLDVVKRAPQLDGKFPKVCTDKEVSVCDQGRCYCHVSKRSAVKEGNVPESAVQKCPSDHILVCHGESCSCEKPRPTPSDNAADPGSCIFGAPICYDKLCYCPINPQTKKRVESPGKVAELVCSHGKPLICANRQCFCYVGHLQTVLQKATLASRSTPSNDSTADTNKAIVALIPVPVPVRAPRPWKNGVIYMTPTPTPTATSGLSIARDSASDFDLSSGSGSGSGSGSSDHPSNATGPRETSEASANPLSSTSGAPALETPRLVNLPRGGGEGARRV